MKEINEDLQEKAEGEDEEEKFDTPSYIKFMCPNDGKIEREDVLFLCNKCRQDELIYKDGIYICPACLNPGENFECVSCGSTKVKMVEKKKKKKK